MKKLVAWLLIALSCFSLSACGKKDLKRYEAEFLVLFDTMTRVIGYAPDKETFTRFSQYVYDSLREYHELYDIYNDYEGVNNIKTINDNAGVAPVKVDPRVIGLLQFAREQYELTGGRMNVAFGAVLRIWHDCREAGNEDPGSARLPAEEELRAAAAHTGIDDVVIDEAAGTVFLRDPLMRLDVGAVGKGYAVERVCEDAERNGYGPALVSVGGNVRAIGGRATGEPWVVGVQNPDANSDVKNLELVSLADRSLVTSGVYERYYTVDGRNYHHIIDPATLYPSVYMQSLTILCRDSGRADALSTAVFNMPAEEGKAYIEGLPDVEALWVLNDGGIVMSDGFAGFIRRPEATATP